MKVGIVANEVFDQRFGSMGGFGFAARCAAQAFAASPDHDAVYVLCKRTPDELGGESDIDGIPIVLYKQHESRWPRMRRLWRHRIDALLTIDYRGGYTNAFRSLPRTPIVTWVHDPRTDDDVAKVNTLALPGDGAKPAGITPIDCTTIQRTMAESRRLRRPFLWGHNARFLVDKMPGTYGVHGVEPDFLPTPLLPEEPPALTTPRAERPTVLYLGRLDPIKRPWVAYEVARRMPHVDVVFLGQSHFAEGAWQPDGEVPNAIFAGHAEGAEKAEWLSKAWLLINPSIHEALPISFLESLSYEVPIVSTQDAGGIATDFGAYVGRHDGDGLGAVPAFVGEIQRLIDAPEERAELGRAGRDYVHEHYTVSGFLEAFDRIVQRR